MSEEESAAEQEALEREVLEQEAARANAFRARFTLGAFEGVARALKWQVDEANLRRLARVLLPEIYAFYENCSGKRPSPSTEAARLRKLRDAAKLLASAADMLLMPVWLIRDPECEHFFTTAARLAGFWDEQAERLSPRVGRPSHAAFHELIANLVWVYERLTKEPAIRPWANRSKPIYGGDFQDFAVAVWQCVRERIPEARDAIPGNDSAVIEAVRKNWPLSAKRRGKN
jgi:hypothetical protein